MTRNLKAVWITLDRGLAARIESVLSAECWLNLNLRSFSEALAMHSIEPIDMFVIDADLPDFKQPGALQESVNMIGGAPIMIFGGDLTSQLGIKSDGPLYVAPKDESMWETVARPIFSLFAETVRGKVEMGAADKKLQALKMVTKTAEVMSSAGERSLDENLNEALKMTLEAMNASRGSIMLIENGDSLVVRATTNPDILGFSQPLNTDSISSISIRQKVSIRGENKSFAVQGEVSGEERGYKSPFLLTIPISFQGTIIGVINVTDKRDAGMFSHEDESMFSMISGVIVTALLSAEVQKERDVLKTVNAKLKKLQEFKETMINMLIHDLKGPAGDIMSNLGILREYVTGDFPLDLLDVAEGSSEELLEMIMSILDLNKIESGQFIINRTETDIVKLAAERTRKTQSAAMRENKTVKFEPEVETLVVKIDERLISRVIWNLLSNANNHTGDGGEIKVSVKRRLEGGGVLTVADNGTGIQKEYLDRIFEKFYQAGESQPSQYSTGLGLTFCKMAVEAHGGRIEAQSEPGLGTVFSVVLPHDDIENPAGNA